VYLKNDLAHLFDNRGIDANMYDERVEFRDPITQYDSIGGYMFNIQMLKQVGGGHLGGGVARGRGFVVG